jgi:phosphoribosylanthranilate isomerase
MPAPWLKICGLTRPEDARLALDLGARYLGCVLVPPSPRAVDVAAAVEIAGLAPGRLVAVVRDLPPETLEEVVTALQPAVLQLHGAETPGEVRRLRGTFPEVEIWKALSLQPVAEGLEAELAPLLAEAAAYAAAGAAALLLDTRTASGSGGTGQTGDWALAAAVVRAAELPVLLAGGLGPENLEAAAAQVQPAGLDVSSGVEARPGTKSSELLEALFAAWRRVEQAG